MTKPHIKNDLVFIKSKLQTEGVSLDNSVEIIDNLSVSMKHLIRITGKNICIKKENILKKNVGLNMLKKIKNILNDI